MSDYSAKIKKLSENYNDIKPVNRSLEAATKNSNDYTDIDYYSSAEIEMLKHKSFALTPDLNKRNKTYVDLKRPCIDFNPCKHGDCDMNNETLEFSCICNVGYMGPFCDLMRHPCDFKPCENGVCEIVGDLYYKCLCNPNFTGVNCHIGKNHSTYKSWIKFN